MHYILLLLKDNKVMFNKVVTEESMMDVLENLDRVDTDSETSLLNWMSTEFSYIPITDGVVLVFNSELLRYRLNIFHKGRIPRKAYLVIVCTDSSDTELIGTYFTNQPHSAARIVLTDYPEGWEGCPFEKSSTVSLSRASKISEGWFEWLKSTDDHIYINSIKGQGGILVIALNEFITYLTKLEKGA